MFAADALTVWTAVMATATVALVIAGSVAGLFAFRTWKDAETTMTAQSGMLQIERERWEEERSERYGLARREAALLRISTTASVGHARGGLDMIIKNDALVPFQDIIVDAIVSDHEEAKGFGYRIAMLGAQQQHSQTISIPSSVSVWRVRYTDVAERRWVKTPFMELPDRVT